MGIDKNEARNRKFTKEKPSGSTTNPVGYSDYVFVDTYLNQSDEQWLEDNRDVSDEYVLSLITELAEGFKLSVSFDQRSKLFLATLTDSSVGSPNRGKIRTARASTAFDAIYALYYKLRHKSPDGLWGEGETNRKWG